MKGVSSDVEDLVKSTQDISVEWFAGKRFSKDWVSSKIPRWVRLFNRFRANEIDVLEVGSYEGRSAIFLLNFLPLAKLTCIDLFKDPLESRFDYNLQGYEDRLEKRKGSAYRHLDELRQSGRQFHLIYLDAGKGRDHVLAMSLITWPLLRDDGMLIWDDYQWGKDKGPEDRPHDAIDIFLDMHADQIEILWKGSQVFVKKLKRDEAGTSPAIAAATG